MADQQTLDSFTQSDDLSHSHSTSSTTSASSSSDPSLLRCLSLSRLNAGAPEFVPGRTTPPLPPQPPRMIIPPPPPHGMLHMYHHQPPFNVPVLSHVPIQRHLVPVQNHHQNQQYVPVRNRGGHQKYHQRGGVGGEQEPDLVTKKNDRRDHKRESKNDQATETGASVSIDSKTGLAEDAVQKIVNQVEYYFSDLNLATTDHLIRFISKDPAGYVPIHVVASFKKIKAVINSNSQLAAVLENSAKLVVSEDGKKVRRINPITEPALEELQSRIIIAENLPEDHCYQNLMKIFSSVGSVKNIRTCQPQNTGSGAPPAARSAKNDGTLFSNKVHAFVEYELVELAEKAVAELNEAGNWRSGLKVRLMLKHQTKEPKQGQGRGRKGHDAEVEHEEDDATTSDQQPIEKQSEECSGEWDTHVQEQTIGEEQGNEKAFQKLVDLIQQLALFEESQKKRIYMLENELCEGELLRKKLHNTIIELKGNIRVFCRVRPLLDDEGHEETVIGYPTSTEARGIGVDLLQRGIKHQFMFDKVFSHEASQEEVFVEISQLVQSALDGYNVCIFAYGQTGSGKTYTMMGRHETPEQKGLIPRSLEQIFQASQSLGAQGWKYKMEVSILEIYNETIGDLLATKRTTTSMESAGTSKKQYTITHDINGHTHVSNLTVFDVCSIAKISSLLETAAQNRSVGKTQMNEQSSRSHFVFSMRISGVNKRTEQQVQGVLNLIDLAGSQRLSKSGASGVRLKETQAINKSLSALSDVIFALAKKEDHVPYRNSKLTYLLQPYLGGDSKTLMFINISPDPSSADETLCSLRFASRVNACEIAKKTKLNAATSACKGRKLFDNPSPVLNTQASSSANKETASLPLSVQFEEVLDTVKKGAGKHQAVEVECSPWKTYSAHSSKLKKSLAGEYVSFLNTAAKEDLMKLKGIGETIATNIVGLQKEASDSEPPFKTLDDLKKIGLTEKQVKGLIAKEFGEIGEIFP